jgi:hypothetical protein
MLQLDADLTAEWPLTDLYRTRGVTVQPFYNTWDSSLYVNFLLAA